LHHSLRAIGIDDGYFPPHFKGRKGRTVVVAVLMENIKLVDAELDLVYVDGDECTAKVIELISRLGSSGRADVVLLDGVTYAGFNYVNPYVVFEKTGIPTLTIFRYPLDLNEVLKALRKNFTDYEGRFAIIRNVYLNSIKITSDKGTIEVTPVGIDEEKAYEVVTSLQYTSATPEPLRIADIIASGISITTYRALRISLST